MFNKNVKINRYYDVKSNQLNLISIAKCRTKIKISNVVSDIVSHNLVLNQLR